MIQGFMISQETFLACDKNHTFALKEQARNWNYGQGEMLLRNGTRGRCECKVPLISRSSPRNTWTGPWNCLQQKTTRNCPANHL